MTSARFTPGLYEDVAARPPAETAVRDDIAAFVGLTRRGPLDVAVRIESWEEFRARFGDRSDEFFLPDAVLGFFRNGGRTCYVVRVLHRTPLAGETLEDTGLAAHAQCLALRMNSATGPWPRWVAAQLGVQDRGAWGNLVAVAVRFTTRPITPTPTAIDDGRTASRLLLDSSGIPGSAGTPGRSEVSRGEVLWVIDSVPPRFSVIEAVEPATPPSMRVDWFAVPQVHITLAHPLELAKDDVLVIVEASVDVLTRGGQREHFERLGLDPRHPRYLPRVLAESSRLVALKDDALRDLEATLYPAEIVADSAQPSPPDALAVAGLSGGADGLEKITRDDFFDPDPDAERPEHNVGLHQLDRLRDVSLVVMPDLVLPAAPPVKPVEPSVPPPPRRKRARFVCAGTDLPDPAQMGWPEDPPPPPPRPYNLLDPAATGQWQDLANAEARLVKYCDDARDRIALLAPPPSADVRGALLWRSRFDSAFVAAYYPWLELGDPVTDPPVRWAPPTGVAAGIIARSEAASGVGRAPANLVAAITPGLARAVSPDEWALLHEVSFDVFRKLPSEIRLLGGRTLSSDRDFRYLHVRRLLTHIQRVVLRRLSWVAFEPNTADLWSQVIHDLDGQVLLPLFERGAFAGKTPDESYFIQCDEQLNPPEQIAVGQLRCDIGVAPNIPAEYIVFRLEVARETGVQILETV